MHGEEPSGSPRPGIFTFLEIMSFLTAEVPWLAVLIETETSSIISSSGTENEINIQVDSEEVEN